MLTLWRKKYFIKKVENTILDRHSVERGFEDEGETL